MYSDIIQGNTITSLIKYCRNSFQSLRQSMKISRKVYLITLMIPFSETNGFTVSVGHKNRALDFVFINLWPFRKKELSATMASFYLFSVVAHELKHVQILEEWYEGKTDTFGVLFSEWAVKHVGGEGFFNTIIRFYFSSKGTSQLRKKRYDVSPIELICYHFGFQKSFDYYAHLLSQQELEIVSTFFLLEPKIMQTFLTRFLFECSSRFLLTGRISSQRNLGFMTICADWQISTVLKRLII